MAKKSWRANYEAADVLGLYEGKTQEVSEQDFRAFATLIRQHCKLKHPVNIPGEYRAITKEVRTPYIRDAWSRISASLVSKPPIVKVQPRDERKQEFRESAIDAARWDMAAIERMNEATGEDAIYNTTSALVRDGESVLKLVHRKDAWAAFPRSQGPTEPGQTEAEKAAITLERQEIFKKGVDLPFAWRAVDRLSCLFGDGEFGDSWCLEYGEYPRPYIKSRFDVEYDGDGRILTPERLLGGHPMPEGAGVQGSSGMTTKIEFWDANEWHVLLDGTEAPGFPKKNPYSPHLPLIRAKGHDSESLLYSLLYLVPRMDELLTMKLNWAYLGSYPNPVVRTLQTSQTQPGLDGMTGAERGTEQPIIWKPGQLIDLPEGKDLSFLVPPPIGADTNDLLNILRSLTEVAGIPSVMRGAGGDASGYQANQMLSAASMQYKLASHSLQRQYEQALEFLHWMVANLVRQTVYVQGWQEGALNERTGRPKKGAEQAWLALSPDTQKKPNQAAVNMLGPVTFTFRPTLPTDEQARAMIAIQLTSSPVPLSSVQHALERWLEEEDPEEIMRQMAVEKALQSEPLASMITQRALEEAGLVPPAQPEATPSPVGGIDPSQIGALLGGGGGGAIPPGPNGLVPQVPDSVTGGVPSVIGLNQTVQPTAPQGIPGNTGGREAGMYPGIPGNQGG